MFVDSHCHLSFPELLNQLPDIRRAMADAQVDRALCICTTLEERRGRLTGRYVHGDCCGAEKALRILQRYELDRYSHVYAYGDSGEDREMLALAHRKYYRWKEIVSWSEVTKTGHPSPARPGTG